MSTKKPSFYGRKGQNRFINAVEMKKYPSFEIENIPPKIF
jgi:hypothetical protein